MYYTRMDDKKTLEIHKLISRFLSASTCIEKYLQRRGPLTPTQWKSISLAVSMIQFYLDTSVKHHGQNTKSIGNAAAVLGSLGGLKGGKARARKLSARRRVAIAKLAALSRWRKRR